MDHLIFRAAAVDKEWMAPPYPSREYDWVAERMGLSPSDIRRTSNQAKMKYLGSLKTEAGKSLAAGLALLLAGVAAAFKVELVHWAPLSLMGGGAAFLMFFLGKRSQLEKDL